MPSRNKNQDNMHKKEQSIAEKGLILINNDKEWQMLKARLRSSGVTTNCAARLMILDYLSHKPDDREGLGWCQGDEKTENQECKSQKRSTQWGDVWLSNKPKPVVETELGSNISIHADEQPRITQKDISRANLMTRIRSNISSRTMY